MRARIRKPYQALRFTAILLLIGGEVYAKPSSDDDGFPTFFINVGAGLTTYKSKAVESNDTSLSTGYGLGMYGGGAKNIGVLINSESNTTSFLYANDEKKSKITTVFFDTLLRYRLGPLYFGPVFHQMQLSMLKMDEETLDNLATGYGFNAGLALELQKRSKFLIDIVQTSTSQVKDIIQEANASPVSVTNRLDIYIGSSIKLTRSLLDLQLGYKQRSFTLNVAGESFAELQTLTWVGFGLNAYF